MPTPVFLPTKPYIAEYLLTKVFRNAIVDKTTAEGYFLIELLEKDTDEYGSRPTFYPNNIKLFVSNNQVRKHGGWMNATQATVFNNFVTKIIKKEIRSNIVAFMSIHKSVTLAVDHTRKVMQLPEELYSTDAIIKDFQRYRKDLEQAGYTDTRVYNKV